MPPDLDTLLVALYVLADDFLPKRSGPGRPPRINDASVIALAVAQVFLDCPNERRFLRLARGPARAPVPVHARAVGLQQACPRARPADLSARQHARAQLAVVL